MKFLKSQFGQNSDNRNLFRQMDAPTSEAITNTFSKKELQPTQAATKVQAHQAVTTIQEYFQILAQDKTLQKKLGSDPKNEKWNKLFDSLNKYIQGQFANPQDNLDNGNDGITKRDFDTWISNKLEPQLIKFMEEPESADAFLKEHETAANKAAESADTAKLEELYGDSGVVDLINKVLPADDAKQLLKQAVKQGMSADRLEEMAQVLGKINKTSEKLSNQQGTDTGALGEGRKKIIINDLASYKEKILNGSFTSDDKRSFDRLSNHIKSTVDVTEALTERKGAKNPESGAEKRKTKKLNNLETFVKSLDEKLGGKSPQINSAMKQVIMATRERNLDGALSAMETIVENYLKPGIKNYLQWETNAAKTKTGSVEHTNRRTGQKTSLDRFKNVTPADIAENPTALIAALRYIEQTDDAGRIVLDTVKESGESKNKLLKEASDWVNGKIKENSKNYSTQAEKIVDNSIQALESSDPAQAYRMKQDRAKAIKNIADDLAGYEGLKSFITTKRESGAKDKDLANIITIHDDMNGIYGNLNFTDENANSVRMGISVAIVEIALTGGLIRAALSGGAKAASITAKAGGYAPKVANQASKAAKSSRTARKLRVAAKRTAPRKANNLVRRVKSKSSNKNIKEKFPEGSTHTHKLPNGEHMGVKILKHNNDGTISIQKSFTHGHKGSTGDVNASYLSNLKKVDPKKAKVAKPVEAKAPVSVGNRGQNIFPNKKPKTVTPTRQEAFKALTEKRILPIPKSPKPPTSAKPTSSPWNGKPPIQRGKLDPKGPKITERVAFETQSERGLAPLPKSPKPPTSAKPTPSPWNGKPPIQRAGVGPTGPKITRKSSPKAANDNYPLKMQKVTPRGKKAAVIASSLIVGNEAMKNTPVTEAKTKLTQRPNVRASANLNPTSKAGTKQEKTEKTKTTAEKIKAIDAASLRSKQGDIIKILDKYKSYKAGDWNKINEAVAQLFDIKFENDSDKEAFGKKLQKEIASKLGLTNRPKSLTDGKIGKDTMKYMRQSFIRVDKNDIKKLKPRNIKSLKTEKSWKKNNIAVAKLLGIDLSKAPKADIVAFGKSLQRSIGAPIDGALGPVSMNKLRESKLLSKEEK